VAVNCGGLTSSLLEDTLFGHEKGSFTGACGEHRGVFEQAQGGTLFLDEIGEIPLSQQASLLRILDDGVVRRVGGRDDRRVEFRLVTATNRDLERLAAEGHFRLDLFHRLSALRIATSPLRQRPEDIPLLAEHFLSLMATEVGHKRLSMEASRRLARSDLPGNARQLRNLLYRAAVFAQGHLIRVADLEREEPGRETGSSRAAICDLSDVEVAEVLRRHRGNISGAAKELRVPRTSLRDRIRRLPRDHNAA
jgi:DNA-binding NtrC family response regulator